MIQADCVHSTPPTNTPIDTTRRRILTIAGGAFAAAAALPSPARASGPSLALLGALEALESSRGRLEDSRAAYCAACAHVDRWEAENPKPASKKGLRRWLKRASKYCDAVSAEHWQNVLIAEVDFHHAQEAVAAIKCTGPADLRLMIEASVVHDSRQLSITNRAPIARAVVRAIAGGMQS